MAAATKKEKKRSSLPWKAGACSGHTTNLKQSILETFDIYILTPLILSTLGCGDNHTLSDENMYRQCLKRDVRWSHCS
jgi:hypothetical protein